MAMRAILLFLALICLLAISCTNKQKSSLPDTASIVAVTGDSITGRIAEG